MVVVWVGGGGGCARLYACAAGANANASAAERLARPVSYNRLGDCFRTTAAMNNTTA